MWSAYDADTVLVEDITKAFLGTELLRQFRDRPDCLVVEILDERSLSLRLDRFPELDISNLNPRELGCLELEGFDMSGGYVTSGGPDGIYLQYGYVQHPRSTHTP